jgi:hypothetical protein
MHNRKCHRKSYGFNTKLLQRHLDLHDIDACEYVDDFLKEFNKESQFSIPKDSAITLYQLKDGQEVEIDVGNSPADYVTENSRKNHLVVMTTAVSKSSRQVNTGKMSEAH